MRCRGDSPGAAAGALGRRLRPCIFWRHLSPTLGIVSVPYRFSKGNDMNSSTQAPVRSYGFGRVVNLPYDQTTQRTREALKEQGFGVLTEIDVKATMKAKLDAEFRPYIILGACNPPLAHRALSAELGIGLLLPCNVIVYAADEAGKSVVGALDPVEALSISGNEALRPLASEVRGRLERVLADVSRT